MAERQGRVHRRVLGRMVTAALLFLSLVATAWALSPQMQKGLNWLAVQVQSAGSLLNENGSVASPLQNRDEADRTLQLLSPGSTLADVTQDDYAATEYLAREILSLSAQGTSVSTQVAALTAAQNADGGFGSAAGMPSDPLNSAWALMALGGQSGNGAISGIKQYLLTQVLPDGGVSGLNLRSRMETTALTLLGMATQASDINTLSTSHQLATWLAAQQGVDGSWAGDVYLTGFAMGALAPIWPDTTLQQSGQTYLLAKQGSDGSWASDPFLTAVVLRALSQVGTVPSLTNTIGGQVIAYGSGQPLPGVVVALSGNSVTASSNGQGNFLLSGLPAGAATLALSAPGYQASTVAVSVPVSGVVSLGALFMVPVVGSSTLSGIVTDATTHQPLSGASLTVSGSSTQSTTTNAQGYYQVAGLTDSAVTVTVSASGYVNTTATVTLGSAPTVAYQPVLYAQGQTPTIGNAQLTGQVVALGTNQPLVNVAVLVNQQAVTTTDSNGNYSLSLAGGSYTLSYQLAGYTTTSAGITVNNGDVSTLSTVFMGAPATSTTISGVITDSATSKPVVGASVQVVGGVTVTTDSHGNYTLANLAGTQFSLRASAPGYNSQNIQIQVTQPSTLLQNFSLTAQAGQGVSVAPLNVSPGSAGLNADVLVSTTYSNNGGSNAQLIPLLQLINSDGKVVSTAAAYADKP